MHKFGERTAPILVLAAAACFFVLEARAQPRPRESPTVVVPTRLAMAATVERADVRVSKSFKGRPGRRTLRLPEEPAMVGRMNDITRRLQAAGWTYRDDRNERGERVRIFERPPRELARFTSDITIGGRAKVTQSLDVAVDLDKPDSQVVWSRTRAIFAEGLDQATRDRLTESYKSWLSQALDRAIAEQERQPVILDGNKKQQLRRPERATVSQSRPFEISGDGGRLTVVVRSSVVDRALALP